MGRVWIRKADQVIERDQARVVMPVLEPKRLAQRIEQVGLAGARGADEQERVFGDQRREDDGFVAAEPVHAEIRQTVARLTVRRARGWDRRGSGRTRRGDWRGGET